jgi:predicted dehydrogenase
MISVFAPIDAFCSLDIPLAHRLPIAIIGAGGIVADAHLPAYQQAGLEIVGITDVDRKRAGDVADRFGIPTVYSSVESLLEDDQVAVVDIAVPYQAQPDIFRRVATAGKHILAQKPLAASAREAADLADIAEAHHIRAAVNQQLRFDEGIAGAYAMLKQGWIGEVSAMSITVNITTPWHLWKWALHAERLEVLMHSIHYHDVIRWFLGKPVSVHCVAGRTKGQLPVGETRSVTSYRYPEDVVAVVHANHVNIGGDNSAAFRIDGSHGSIRGTLGLLSDYPDGRPDTLEVNSLVVATDGWLPYPVTRRWIPDAFAGTMGSLLEEIATGEPARSTIRDNVQTMQIVESLYTSIEEQREVRI